MAEDLPSKATEMMRKVLTIGVGAIFLTEESLRTLITDFKIPKELISGILDSANRSKNEFLQALSRDVLSRISDKVDAVKLLEEFFAKNDIDLHMKISFRSKGGASVSPSAAGSAANDITNTGTPK